MSEALPVSCQLTIPRGGFSSNFLSKGGICYDAVWIWWKAWPDLQIAEGWTVEIDPKFINCWTNVQIVPGPLPGLYPVFATKPAFRDVCSVMNNWGANHGAIGYGHIGQDLITMASMLQYPVCMHNVRKMDLWVAADAFGVDKEGRGYELAQFMVLSINNANQQLKYLIKIQYLKTDNSPYW